MSFSNNLQEAARQYALQAVEHDRNGKHESAVFYYLVIFQETKTFMK